MFTTFRKRLGAAAAIAALSLAQATGCGDDSVITNNINVPVPVELLGPDVALFMNSDYVGNSTGWWDDSDEASNLLVTLSYLGYSPYPVFGTSADDLEDSLAGKGVLVIPEMENGDLGSDLSDDAVAVLNTFIENGGVIVAMGQNDGDKTSGFINALLGTSVNNTENGSEAMIQDDAEGTSFTGAQPRLPYGNGTYPLDASSLPDTAKVIYQNGSEVWVAAFESGLGGIVFLAYDWYDSRPVGLQDGGWNDILARALAYRGAVPLRPTSVSLFMNSSYNDVDFTNSDSEATNLYYSLLHLGYHVLPWISTNDMDTTRALFGRANVAVIPEFEEPEFDFVDELIDGDGMDLISDFVEDGGILILHGSCGGELDLINYFFEASIDCYEEAYGSISKLGLVADGTSFSVAPDTISGNNATLVLESDDLPGSALAMYMDENDESVVVVFPYYNGAFIWLGYDWFDAAPFGEQDNGWLDVIDAAVRYNYYYDDD